MRDLKAVYVPAPRSAFTELSRTPTGKLYRKRILKFGEFPHPADPSQKLLIDAELANKLVENFDNGVCDIVQIPVADDKNRHVEDPLRNLGEVIEVDVQLTADPVRAPDGPGVYANMDFRKEPDAPGKTLLGTSAMIHMDYPDTRTGKSAGPTLLHTLMTNRPYLTDLGDFREVVAASADTYDQDEIVVFGAQEEIMPTLEELQEALKNDHNIDVVALSSHVEELEAEITRRDEEDAQTPDPNAIVTQLSRVLTTAGATVPNHDGDVTIEDVGEAIVELSNEFASRDTKIAELEAQRAEDRKQAASIEVDSLVKDGRILPKQRDKMVELSMSDRDTFEALLPEKPVVQLSEQGVTTFDTRSEEMAAEVARLHDLIEPKKS